MRTAHFTLDRNISTLNERLQAEILGLSLTLRP